MIASVEPRIAEATRPELADQRASLKLIASENYASPAVLLTMGTWFSDKYAEGTVGHRFYAGCQNVDTVESLAAEHARELFGAEYAYAQPHSGIDANLVAFWSILAHRVEAPALEKLGAKNVNELSEERLGDAARTSSATSGCSACRLDAGGHLTHGFRPNISGKMFHQRSTAPTPRPGCSTTTGCAAKAREFKPLMLVAGYSAYPRRVNFAKMREIADEVGATLMVDMAHFAGLVAGKVFTGDEDPVPHAHVTTTTTHKSLRGPARRPGAGAGGVRRRRRPRLPDGARRPAVARDGGQGRGARRGPAGRLPDLRPARSPTTPSRWPTASCHRGANLVTGGTDNHIVLLDVHLVRAHRPAGRVGAARRRASSPTATRCRPTRTAPGTPPASGSAPRR